jgi:hypothetical protein
LIVLLQLALEREMGECDQRALLKERENTKEGMDRRREGTKNAFIPGYDTYLSLCELAWKGYAYFNPWM